MQAAVDHQLGDFAKSQPNTKISLVTFNNEVTIFGDGKNDTVTVTGDKLSDNDALVKVGTEASLPASIKDTRESLSSKLFRYICICTYTHIIMWTYVHTHTCAHTHTHTHNTHIYIYSYPSI